jgi:hypothetical protein
MESSLYRERRVSYLGGVEELVALGVVHIYLLDRDLNGFRPAPQIILHIMQLRQPNRHSRRN